MLEMFAVCSIQGNELPGLGAFPRGLIFVHALNCGSKEQDGAAHHQAGHNTPGYLLGAAAGGVCNQSFLQWCWWGCARSKCQLLGQSHSWNRRRKSLHGSLLRTFWSSASHLQSNAPVLPFPFTIRVMLAAAVPPSAAGVVLPRAACGIYCCPQICL